MKTAFVAILLTGLSTASANAQTASQAKPEELSAALVTDSGTKDQPNPLRQKPAEHKADSAALHRWIDLQAAPMETRYRYIDTSAGVTAANQWQHKESVKAAFKFDPQGRYTVQTFMGTGNSFTGSWDTTGVGTGDPLWDFRVRRLYAQAAPVKGLELAAGSFDVLRGETTEIVSYDNDAFMQGYRVSIKRPRQFFLDEISVTAGYLGDLTTTNVFKRFKWMNDHNYTQALVAKKIAPAIAASFDYTTLSNVATVREGVKLTTKKAGHVIDGVRVELYQRVDAPEGHGYAFTADRALSHRVSVNGGFANIDKNNGALNGDRFGRGKRMFTGGTVTILPELVASVFYTHAVDNAFAVGNADRLDVILTYNVLKALQQHHAW
jgi:hypothetical protein